MLRGMGLREAARSYNVPVETLRQRVNGNVAIDCRPGPETVLQTLHVYTRYTCIYMKREI